MGHFWIDVNFRAANSSEVATADKHDGFVWEAL